MSIAPPSETAIHSLSCFEGETIFIGQGIEVTVIEIDGDDVVLRIDGLNEPIGEERAAAIATC